MIPLPIILVEFLLAFGAALFLGQAVAIVQLRRHDNWPPTRPARPSTAVPSRSRLLTLLVIGAGVSLWSLATLVTRAQL